MNKKMTKQQFYLLSFTWGFILSSLGAIIMGVLKLMKHEIKPNQYGYCCEIGENWGGFSLGPFCIVEKNPNQVLLNHEFGHALQNCYFGPFMIIVTLMSVIRYLYRKEWNPNLNKELPDYDSIWFEGTATYLGNYYKNN